MIRVAILGSTGSIGRSALEVIGPPTRRNPDKGELIYAETESMPTAMVVTVRNDRIVRIEWEFYFS